VRRRARPANARERPNILRPRPPGQPPRPSATRRAPPKRPAAGFPWIKLNLLAGTIQLWQQLSPPGYGPSVDEVALAVAGQFISTKFTGAVVRGRCTCCTWGATGRGGPARAALGRGASGLRCGGPSTQAEHPRQKPHARHNAPRPAARPTAVLP
jgi:hypothetical protein